MPTDYLPRLLIRSGYHFQRALTFTLDGRPENLSGATIYASVVNEDKTSELIADVAQSSAASGADWPNGKVVIKFPASATADLSAQNCWIEVAVTLNSERLPYDHIPARIEKGYTLT